MRLVPPVGTPGGGVIVVVCATTCSGGGLTSASVIVGPARLQHAVFRYTSQRATASRNPASGSRVGMNSCAK
jgi:hypothetical protein